MRGLKIETAERSVADDGGDCAAEGFEFRLGTGDGGVAGEDAGFLQAHDHGIADGDLEAAGEGVVEGDCGLRGSKGRSEGVGPRCERPKGGGHADELNLVDRAAGGGIGRGAAGDERGRGLGAGGGGEIVGEGLAEKAVTGGEDVGGAADALFADAPE